MRRILQWLGWLLCVIGAMLIGTYVAMSSKGLAPSYNIGDPAKFQFILVPFWQIGLVIAAVGGTCLFASRWFNRAQS
jgi:hypothetical protein